MDPAEKRKPNVSALFTSRRSSPGKKRGSQKSRRRTDSKVKLKMDEACSRFSNEADSIGSQQTFLSSQKVQQFSGVREAEICRLSLVKKIAIS